MDQWRGVHDVEKAPTHTKTDGKRSSRAWLDASGNTKIEVNIIAGMGHGTPIGGGLGVPAPYMLDVGISSTREIAQSWDIAHNPSHSELSTTATTAEQRLPALPAVQDASYSKSNGQVLREASTGRATRRRETRREEDHRGRTSGGRINEVGALYAWERNVASCAEIAGRGCRLRLLAARRNCWKCLRYSVGICGKAPTSPERRRATSARRTSALRTNDVRQPLWVAKFPVRPLPPRPWR